MPVCKTDERMFKRNYTLKRLKQMLCKLENKYYEKDEQVSPTLLLRAQRCVCAPEKKPLGKFTPTVYLDGGEAFPYNNPKLGNVRWCPKYQCLNQEINADMGCYKAAKVCKECDMCCECEVAEGSHLHLPKIRDCTKPLRKQCYTSDVCTKGSIKEDTRGYKPDCDPNLYPNRWFPNVNHTCQFPKACSATCYDHPDLKDWFVTKPSYTYYLQHRCFTYF